MAKTAKKLVKRTARKEVKFIAVPRESGMFGFPMGGVSKFSTIEELKKWLAEETDVVEVYEVARKLKVTKTLTIE
jgi:hypothetical protein